jgi:hypothetical protein
MPTSEVAFVRPAGFEYPFEDEDDLVPQGTWIADFVESMRGIETPTLFCLWSALWTLSAATVREVGLAWLEEEPLFPNLYVFIVAPAGRCHKTTAISHAAKVLDKLHHEFPGAQFAATRSADDAFLREMTKFAWVTSRTTAEGFEVLLVTDADNPEGIPIPHSRGIDAVRRGAQMTICAGQLNTFLNKSKYTSNMVDTLTELYDCRAHQNYLTKSGGNRELHDVYVTMIGAITPDEMKESLPDASRGDGFLSRVCVVARESTLRCFRHPMTFEGFPTTGDLARKLAFLLRTKRSTKYRLSLAADEWHDAWYRDWKAKIDADPTYLERTGEQRLDVILLRIALLIRFSRYESEDRLIEVEDLECALAILTGSFKEATAQKRVMVSKEGFSENYQVITRYIARNAIAGVIERRKVLSYMSQRGVSARDVDTILRQLEEEGVLECPETSTKKGTRSYRVIANVDTHEDNASMKSSESPEMS